MPTGLRNGVIQQALGFAIGLIKSLLKMNFVRVLLFMIIFNAVVWKLFLAFIVTFKAPPIPEIETSQDEEPVDEEYVLEEGLDLSIALGDDEEVLILLSDDEEAEQEAKEESRQGVTVKELEHLSKRWANPPHGHPDDCLAPKKCAYVTMMTTNEYFSMVAVLAESLKMTGSNFPLLVMTSYEVTTDVISALERIGCTIIRRSSILLPPTVHPTNERWVAAFNKLHLWALIKYERLIWMDADTILVRHLDELFKLTTPLVTARNMHSCTVDPDRVCSMMMVLKPNVSVHTSLLQYLRSGYPFENGDQELLEAFFLAKSALQLVDEQWASFVYRCMCEKYDNFMKMISPTSRVEPRSEVGPALIHFTGHFSPILSKGMLASNAHDCAVPYYAYWIAVHDRVCATEVVAKHCISRETLLERMVTLFPSFTTKQLGKYVGNVEFPIQGNSTVPVNRRRVYHHDHIERAGILHRPKLL